MSSVHAPQKMPLHADILSLLGQVAHRFEPGDNEMRQWMVQHFQDSGIVELLEDMTLVMLRVLDAIGSLEPVNGITISKQSRIPKGSVSKITRRLIARKLITQESLPNNKKEILFRTTPAGRALFEAHRTFDAQMERRFIEFLQRYSDDELRFLVRVLRDVMEAPWLNPEA